MLPLLEHLAVVSAGCFGVLLARSKGMDIIGACCIAFTVAFGGGTLRDVLLDRTPLFWIAEERYAWVVLSLAVVGSLLPRLPSKLNNWLHLPDALGLGLFSIVGAGIALEQGTSHLIATLFGVITGTFGGVFGDIACNEVPSLFRPGVPLYATCSFLGCWSFLGLIELGIRDTPAQWIAVAIIVLMRMASLRFGWSLPTPKK